MARKWSDENLIIMGLQAVADAFAGTVSSDVIDCAEAGRATFIRHQGAGATGTSTLTVEACDDTVPTSTTAIAFKSKRVANTASSDVPGALTTRAAAGFDTTAGANQMYIIEVDPALVRDAGYRYVRLKNVEVVDSPVLGGILCVLSQLRHEQATPTSQID